MASSSRSIIGGLGCLGAEIWWSSGGDKARRWQPSSFSHCRAWIGSQSCSKYLKTTNVGTRRRQRGRTYVSSALAIASQPLLKTSSGKSLQLPVDYYQVLGAEANYTPDAIVRAYEARVSNPPTEGFSQEALEARREILKVACDTLADRDFRYEYDKGLKDQEAATLVVEVPWSKVSGALCLLQEVGEVEVVLQAGQALLDDRLSNPLHQDVVLVMALAYVELSREAMDGQPPAVVRGCDLLNAALTLLQTEGGRTLAPALQEQIYEILEEITPRCVLELLGLPLDEEHAAQRQEGLQEVRNILWAAGEGGGMAPVGGFTREQFLKEAFSRMTSAEQVALFTETPANIPAERLEVYSVALAHVAEGFSTKNPSLIQEASTLFLQLQESFARPKDDGMMSDEMRDVVLGRSLTLLLLGEVENCRLLLGLEDENFSFRCPAVVDFVLSNSEGAEDGDFLPGMCKLLESWLAEEVFENFRNTVGMHVRLSDYYDDPGVLNYLEKLEKGTSPLEAAAAIVRIGAGAGAALDSVRSTIQKVFPLVTRERKNMLSAESVPEISTEDGPIMVEKSAGSTALRMACVGAVSASLLVAGARYLPLRDKFSRFRSEVPSMTAILSSVTLSKKGAAEDKSSDVTVRMDTKLAEQLIRKWQSAKAQALGMNHSISQLQEILDGQMLKSWTDRALEVSKHGWYWDYKLLDLTIDSVTISEDGRRAMVETTLQEAARLFDSKHPEHNDAYKSSYTTRYELSHGRNGWRITGGAVLRT